VAPSDPLLGTTITERYAVRDVAHDEALGRVYTAWDTDDDRLVHIKVLRHEFANDTKKFERFGREITATFMVTHPNTVEVLDFGEDDGRLFLVLEFLVGHDLSSELVRGAIAPERVAHIAAQIAAAIGAAHQEGIVHRNLCPDNILLLDHAVEGDAVKVRDFGLSKLESVEVTEDGLTTGNTRMGVAAYTAPEYLSTGNFHLKGDLYALGALMWHMLVGQPPYEGPIDQVLNGIMTAPPPPPSENAADVPEWLDQLVVDLLSRDPADRPGAYKVQQQLEKGTGQALGMPDLLDLDADGRPVPLPAEAASSRGWIGLAVVALVAVVSLVGLGVVVIATALSILLLRVAA